MGKLLLHKIVSGVWFGLLGTAELSTENQQQHNKQPLFAAFRTLLRELLEKAFKIRSFLFFCLLSYVALCFLYCKISFLAH